MSLWGTIKDIGGWIKDHVALKQPTYPYPSPNQFPIPAGGWSGGTGGLPYYYDPAAQGGGSQSSALPVLVLAVVVVIIVLTARR